LKARAEWICFDLGDDARVESAWRASMAPLRSRLLLLGGLGLILAVVAQAVWRDVSYAGTAVLLFLPAMAAWIVLLFAWPAPGLAFHVALDQNGLRLQRAAHRLPACGRCATIGVAQLQRLELIRYPGALQVYKGSGPLARLAILLHTHDAAMPLVRITGMDLPVPQRWSLQQIALELAQQCERAGVPVERSAGLSDQQSGQIRASWLNKC